ncbi:MAG: cell division protein ZapA [Hyphomicrobiales bacterium]|nr:cell division protein ZapA [Hyphomicrobiales bacterium]
MAQVSVTINGHSFRMGCDDGQENHLLGLCAEVNNHIETFKEMFGEVGDMRLLAMAALLIADERFEMRQKLNALSGSIAEQKDATAFASEQLEADQQIMAAQLNDAAARIEAVNETLGSVQAARTKNEAG